MSASKEEYEKALKLKEEGNSYFRKGELDTATLYYYQAIQELKDSDQAKSVVQLRVQLHGNIALCYYKLREYHISLNFAKRSLLIDNLYAKGNLIKARIYAEYGLSSFVVEELRDVLKERYNKQLESEIEKYNSMSMGKRNENLLEKYIKDNKGVFFQYEKPPKIDPRLMKFVSKIIEEKPRQLNSNPSLTPAQAKNRWYQLTLTRVSSFLDVNVLTPRFFARYGDVMIELLQLWSVGDDEFKVVVVEFFTTISCEHTLSHSMIEKYQIMQRLLEFLYICTKKNLKRGIVSCFQCLKILTKYLPNHSFPNDLITVGRSLVFNIFNTPSILTSLEQAREAVHILGHLSTEDLFRHGWSVDEREQICRCLANICEEGSSFDESTRVHAVKAMAGCIDSLEEMNKFPNCSRVIFGYLCAPSLTARKCLFDRLESLYVKAYGVLDVLKKQQGTSAAASNKTTSVRFVERIGEISLKAQSVITQSPNESSIRVQTKHLKRLLVLFQTCIDPGLPTQTYIESGLHIGMTLHENSVLPDPFDEETVRVLGGEDGEMRRQQYMRQLNSAHQQKGKSGSEEDSSDVVPPDTTKYFDEMFERIYTELKNSGVKRYMREYYMLRCKHLIRQGKRTEAKKMASEGMDMFPDEYYFHYVYTLYWDMNNTCDVDIRDQIQKNYAGIELAREENNYVVSALHYNLAEIFFRLGSRDMRFYEAENQRLQKKKKKKESDHNFYDGMEEEVEEEVEEGEGEKRRTTTTTTNKSKQQPIKRYVILDDDDIIKNYKMALLRCDESLKMTNIDARNRLEVLSLKMRVFFVLYHHTVNLFPRKEKKDHTIQNQQQQQEEEEEQVEEEEKKASRNEEQQQGDDIGGSSKAEASSTPDEDEELWKKMMRRRSIFDDEWNKMLEEWKLLVDITKNIYESERYVGRDMLLQDIHKFSPTRIRREFHDSCFIKKWKDKGNYYPYEHFIDKDGFEHLAYSFVSPELVLDHDAYERYMNTYISTSYLTKRNSISEKPKRPYNESSLERAVEELNDILEGKEEEEEEEEGSGAPRLDEFEYISFCERETGRKRCDVCGYFTVDIRICRGCGTKKYCGRSCQKRDWDKGQHSKDCKEIRTRKKYI